MVDNTIEIDKLIVGYNPDDFFYSTVDHGLTDLSCNKYLSDPTWETTCNEANLGNNTNDCINVELCKNNQKVKHLYDRNKRKSENHERNLNTVSVYRTEYITMWNLGIAIVGLLIAAYYLFWGSSAIKMAGDLADSVSSRISGMTTAQGQTGNLEEEPSEEKENATPPETKGGRRRKGSPTKYRKKT